MTKPIGTPPGRRTEHLVTVAGGLLDTGDPTNAGRALVIADTTAQAEVRDRPATRELMARVMRQNPYPPAPVLQLAEAMGVTL